jgi:hypothetical protein
VDQITRAAWRAYRDGRTRLWGRGAQIKFEDKDKVTLLTVTDGWIATRITDQASGLPEIEVNVLDQSGVSESALRDTMRFVVLAGRRHEKRSPSYEFVTAIPQRHKMRFQPIGEQA